MTRLRALLRCWLDVPSRAEMRPLRRDVASQGTLWSLLALERQSCDLTADRWLEARADLDRALEAHGQLRPLVPLEAPQPPAEPPPGFVALCIAAALAVLVGGLLSMRPGSGCTIRGGAECAGGCPPREACRADRCVPAADLRPVPSMGGPL